MKISLNKKNGSWNLLGEITGQNPTPQKKYYPGDNVFKAGEYDYVFDYSKSDQIYIINPAIRGRAERRYKLKEILDKKMLTIEELEKKGLKFEKVKKTTE